MSCRFCASSSFGRIGGCALLITLVLLIHPARIAGQTEAESKQQTILELTALRADVDRACAAQEIKDALDARGEIAPAFVRAVSTWKIPAGKNRREVLNSALSCVTASWRLAKSTLTEKLRDKKVADQVAYKEELDEAKDRYLVLSSVQASMKLLIEDADLYDLKVRAYAATVFSNLFQQNPGDSYFSNPKPYFVVELAQTVTADRTLDTFATLSFKGTAAVTGDTAFETVQEATTLWGEVRVAFWPNILPSPFAGTTNWGQIGVGIAATGGFIGVPTENSESETTSVSFEGLLRAGVLIRELSGKWEGSFTELAYARDPRFDLRNRFYARGRLVLSATNPDVKGHAIGGFIEGSINTRFSSADPDEARLTIGVVLPLDVILESMFPSATKDVNQ